MATKFVPNGLDYVDFMVGLTNAPWDSRECADCGGHGLKPVYCCSGHECGCHGLPVEFEVCGCGRPVPSNDQILTWVKLGERS